MGPFLLPRLFTVKGWINSPLGILLTDDVVFACEASWSKVSASKLSMRGPGVSARLVIEPEKSHQRGLERGLVHHTVQSAQNSGIKVISGAFRTAHRELLHNLLVISLNNLALRLCRLLHERQRGGSLFNPWSEHLPVLCVPLRTRRSRSTPQLQVELRVLTKCSRLLPHALFRRT